MLITVPVWRARLGAGRTHHRFYRRVVEIRDGLVLLSPYYDTAVAGRAPGRRKRTGPG
jgi:hypothetical protein